ncbi:hypothetical protein Tco_1396109 [Tanacetum coccineum]
MCVFQSIIGYLVAKDSKFIAFSSLETISKQALSSSFSASFSTSFCFLTLSSSCSSSCSTLGLLELPDANSDSLSLSSVSMDVKQKKKKMAQVHQVAQGFIEDEWEDIRARVKADEELTQKLQADERDKYSEVDQARMLVDLIN